MNRTTITLPEPLVEKLRRFVGAKTKAEAVRKAIEETMSHRAQIRWLEATRGRRLLDPDASSLRDRLAER